MQWDKSENRFYVFFWVYVMQWYHLGVVWTVNRLICVAFSLILLSTSWLDYENSRKGSSSVFFPIVNSAKKFNKFFKFKLYVRSPHSRLILEFSLLYKTVAAKIIDGARLGEIQYLRPDMLKSGLLKIL